MFYYLLNTFLSQISVFSAGRIDDVKFFYPEEIQDFSFPSAHLLKLKQNPGVWGAELHLFINNWGNYIFRNNTFFEFGSSLLYDQPLSEKPVKGNVGKHIRFSLTQFSSSQVGRNSYFSLTHHLSGDMTICWWMKHSDISAALTFPRKALFPAVWDLLKFSWFFTVSPYIRHFETENKMTQGSKHRSCHLDLRLKFSNINVEIQFNQSFLLLVNIRHLQSHNS